jgi:hypothetical protein
MKNKNSIKNPVVKIDPNMRTYENSLFVKEKVEAAVAKLSKMPFPKPY